MVHKGSSLLPKGIVAVNGDFIRGSTVDLTDESKRVIGRGLTRYSSDEMRLIIRKSSSDIENALGFTHGDEAVHRDDLVLLVDGGFNDVIEQD